MHKELYPISLPFYKTVVVEGCSNLEGVQGVLRPSSTVKFFLSFMGAKLISLFCKMYPSGLQDGTELSSPVPVHGCCCQIPSKGHTSAMQNGLSGSQLPCPREEIPSQFPIRDEGKWPSCTLKGKTPCCKWSQWSWEEYPGVSMSSITSNISTGQRKY